MSVKNTFGQKIWIGVIVAVLVLGASITSHALAADKPSIRITSPTDGQTITSTDIPVTVEVSNFAISASHVGMPDKAGEGHIHVMIDGMNMGVLFNFYTSPSFTLPGDAIAPGPHTLIFDLATNTHVDLEDTVQQVKINYQPTAPRAAPAPAATAGAPEVQIISPADGATVGPQFTIEVKPTNLIPSLGLEGKPNLAGYGHYHVFVDMNMSPTEPGGMMSMAGMVLMPGSNTFNVDLNAWPKGKHTLTVEPVHNDHTPIDRGKAATITINLQDAPPTGGSTPLILAGVVLGIVIVVGALMLRRGQAAPRT